MAQAIQLSTDCALYLCKIYPSLFKAGSVIVPFILAGWEGYQFGYVYLLEDSFPCATLLSRVLNQSVPSDQTEICRWGVSLGNHCKRMKDMLSTLSVVHSNISAQSELKLQNSGFLYKIVRSKGFFARSFLAHVMSVFYRLDFIPNSDKNSICFPAGVIGLPSVYHQKPLLKYVVRQLKMFPNCDIKMDEDEDSPKDYDAGHPIVLYRQLEAIWQLAEKIENETDDVIKSFLDELTRLLDVFVTVGVVHMDIRLSNIFFKVQEDNTVHIVVIDWDDALMLNDVIPGYLHSSDRSIPIPHNCVYATGEVHQYFVRLLRESLSSHQHVNKKARVEGKV
jgi:hypothetical protein